MSTLDTLPADAGAFFDEKAETEAFALVMRPFLEAGFKEGIGNVRAKRADKKVFTDYVRESLKRKSLEHAALATGTTKKKLQEVLQEAVDKGLGIQELGRKIKKLFDVESKMRALRIARTELTDTMNDGSNQTLRAEGYQLKEWSTVIDGQERPDHHAANGQAVGIHDAFRVGGESALYPGDDMLSASQRVNCRCALVGGGMPEDRKRQLGRTFLRAHGALEKKFVVSLRRAFIAQRDRILSQFPSE